MEKIIKSEVTKSSSSKIADRFKLIINITPNLTRVATQHGNIRICLHRFKIINSIPAYCIEDQAVDHVILLCILINRERNKVIVKVLKTENWSISNKI